MDACITTTPKRKKEEKKNTHIFVSHYVGGLTLFEKAERVRKPARRVIVSRVSCCFFSESDLLMRRCSLIRHLTGFDWMRIMLPVMLCACLCVCVRVKVFAHNHKKTKLFPSRRRLAPQTVCCCGALTCRGSARNGLSRRRRNPPSLLTSAHSREHLHPRLLVENKCGKTKLALSSF